jgi:N-acetylglucosamine-6-sulfatase
VVAVAAAILIAGCGGNGEAGTARTTPTSSRPPIPQGRPNLVVVMTDDQTLSAFRPQIMPFTWRFFHGGGTVFNQAFAAPPLCCPARAGFLTGQYPHNHGVFTNVPGYPTLRDPGNTLPVWLRRAGYRTGLVGKYLNNYEKVGGALPAPGWHRWFALYGPAYYYDYRASTNGRLLDFGSSRRDYTTSVINRRALRFVNASGRRPFFLWLTYNAPHLVPAAASRPPCAGDMAQPPSRAAFERFARAPLPRPPSFNEPNVADKARWVQHRPTMSKDRIAQVTRRWRCALATLPAVDRGFKDLVARLRRTGELDRTIIVFLSDNGYFFGEHRIDDDKRLPYEPGIHVPLAVWVPPGLRDGPEPARVTAPVANIDLAPTLLDYAGARPCASPGDCRVLDGRSLRGLLSGQGGRWPEDRGILMELADAFTYAAIRTPAYLYARIRADRQGALDPRQEELYDLRSDPNELRNLLHTDPGGSRMIRAELAARLDALRRCSGTTKGPSTPDPCE